MSTVAPLESQIEKSVEFKRIMIATDFSAASQEAWGYALAIARRYGSEITIVHAIPPAPRRSVPMDPVPPELNRERLLAEQEMERFRQEARLAHAANHVVVEQAPVWDVISSIIEREDPDLLVLGTHGRGILKKLALGSVAEEALRLAPCPVLTVGPKAFPPRSEVADFKNILFATDFGPASAKAFPYALSLAEDCQARLILLHVLPPMPVAEVGPAAYGPATYVAEDLTEWCKRVREESSRQLKELIPRSAKLSAPPIELVAPDFLPEGILDAAMSYEAELIVMGANRTRSPRLAAHISWALLTTSSAKPDVPF